MILPVANADSQQRMVELGWLDLRNTGSPARKYQLPSLSFGGPIPELYDTRKGLVCVDPNICGSPVCNGAQYLQPEGLTMVLPLRHCDFPCPVTSLLDLVPHQRCF